jgi:hypothetical protein
MPQLSCSQVQHFALSRDEVKAKHFWLEIMTFYTADELLVEDETAKDRRSMRATLGWGLRGQTPFVRDPYLTRGGRVSALTLFSHRGFEDWRFTKNTFTAESWQVCGYASHKCTSQTAEFSLCD